jgi:AcrR family transcriptional regulator
MGEAEILKKETKDEIFWKILKAALSLDSRKGHLKWTIAELSRSCRVPRPSIYYYFGIEKKAILLSAVRILGEECFGLSPRRMELWRNGQMYESVKESRQFLQEHHELIGFYFSQRYKDHEVGEALRQLEEKYHQKFKRFFSGETEEKRQRTAALLFGMVFMPGLDRKGR